MKIGIRLAYGTSTFLSMLHHPTDIFTGGSRCQTENDNLHCCRVPSGVAWRHACHSAPAGDVSGCLCRSMSTRKKRWSERGRTGPCDSGFRPKWKKAGLRDTNQTDLSGSLSAVSFFGRQGLRPDAFRQTRDNHPAWRKAFYSDQRREGAASDQGIPRSTLTTES